MTSSMRVILAMIRTQTKRMLFNKPGTQIIVRNVNAAILESNVNLLVLAAFLISATAAVMYLLL